MPRWPNDIIAFLDDYARMDLDGESRVTPDNQPDFLALAERYDADFNPNLPRIVIERGSGVILTDIHGHESIDMSDIIASVGHCHPRHVAALQQAAAQMIVGRGSETNPSRATLIKRRWST